MFKTQLKSAEADISAAATTSVGSARADAAAVTDLAEGRWPRWRQSSWRRAASARAEAELQASLEEYTAALASVSARARRRRRSERLARAESRAKEAERRADALAARLAATLSDSSPSVIDSDSEIAFPLVALSRMKKPELVAELVARGLESDGIVAELRQRLRDARRRDGASLLGSPRTEIRTAFPERTFQKGAAESALKRPLSSHMLFGAQLPRLRGGDRVERRALIGGEVGNGLGARWKATDAAEKKRWEEKARALKATTTSRSWRPPLSDAEGRRKTRVSRTVVGRDPTSYYKVVNGERYDRRVLDDCDAFQKSQRERRPHRGEADVRGRERRSAALTAAAAPKTAAQDGRGDRHAGTRSVTYAWTDEARAFVENKLREER